MNLQPTLEDDLILLKPLAESDFELLYEVAKDPLIWKQHPCFNRYEKPAYAKFFSDSIKSKGALIIIEKSTGKIIGSSRFKKVNHSEDAIEIGWSFLARDKWGGKFNKSMKYLMIDFAFNYMEYIVFYIGKENLRSQKAVQKIGGKRITNLSLFHFVKKRKEDWTYIISKKDWRTKKEARH